MTTVSQLAPLRAGLPHIKELFQTRHYIQCISTCQRLLSRPHDKIHPIHPIHLVYLHFYIALSHDAIAREAAIRSRQGELDLAEKHYLAAIAALSLSESRYLHNVDLSYSPTSSEGDRDARRRASDAGSIDSDRSVSTNATSVADDVSDHQKPVINRTSRCVRFSPITQTVGETAATPKPVRRRPSPIIISKPEVTAAKEENFSTNTVTFASMVNAQLASVRELRKASLLPTIKLSSCRPRSTTNSSRLSSGDFSRDYRAMDQIWQERKNISFRPRFDASSVQQLCRDALNEL